MGNKLCHQPEVFRAIFDYEGLEEDSLPFKKNDHLIALQKNESGWWLCRHVKTKKIGIVPSNFIILDGSQIESQDWWMQCSRGEACSLLSMPSNRDGTFIVRQSNALNTFVLSLKVSSADKDLLRHYRIHKADGGDYYIHPARQFKSLPQLVNYYKKTADELACRLTSACPREIEDVPLKDLELPRSKIKFVTFMGSGSFGEVWKGKLNQKTVAVKKLRELSEGLKGDLLNEAKVHNRMRHKRLINLIGLCLLEEPYLLVMDYMDRGCLRNTLKIDKGKTIKFMDLIDFAAQIVEGMCFIEAKGFIHRDLKTSNVLIDSNNLIKISDFGLSKVQQVYCGNNESLFPVRWSALEVFEQKKFSIKSDVWSFGVLLFELVTYGELPYTREGLENEDIFDFISTGQRIQNPSIYHPQGYFKFFCPDNLYERMLQCWSENPKKRPSFTELVCFFENFEERQLTTQTA